MTGWSPVVHLRDVTRVCTHLTRAEIEYTLDGLMSLVDKSTFDTLLTELLFDPIDIAESTIVKLRLADGYWISFTNEELWILYYSSVCYTDDEFGLSDVFKRANRPIEVVEQTAHHLGCRGPDWREQRELVRERAQDECEFCGENEMDLDTHHRISFRRFNTFEEANQIENLVVVCKPCHRRIESGSGYTPSRQRQERSKVEWL